MSVVVRLQKVATVADLPQSLSPLPVLPPLPVRQMQPSVPLPPDDDPSVDPEQVARLKSDDLGFWADYWNERMQRWDKECRPHHRIDRARDWARHHEALSNATKAAQVAVDAGMSIPAVLDWLMESLRQYALFENVKTGERVLRTVGDSEYNRMSASDNWRQLPEDEVQTVINKRRSKG